MKTLSAASGVHVLLLVAGVTLSSRAATPGSTNAFSLASGAAASETLREVFLNPPEEAKPRGYWVWPHGNFDYRVMREELAEFKAKGLGGVDIFDLGIRDTAKVIPPGPGGWQTLAQRSATAIRAAGAGAVAFPSGSSGEPQSAIELMSNPRRVPASGPDFLLRDSFLFTVIHIPEFKRDP